MLKGCADITNKSEGFVPIESSGETLLPDLKATSFVSDTDFEDTYQSKSVEKNINWVSIERLLIRAKEQTQSELVAVFSVRDSVSSWYSYYLQPLVFTPEAMALAEGETQLFMYELNKDDKGSVPRIAVAIIPAGDKAYREMEEWILPQPLNGDKPAKAKTCSGYSTKGTSSCSTEVVVPGGWTCMEFEGERACSYHDPVTELVCEGDPDCEGGGSDYNWPSGGGGGSSGSDGTNENESCRPPYGCEEEANPCEQVNKLENDSAFRQRMNNLKSFSTSENYEVGYLLTGLVGDAGYSYTTIQGNSNDPLIDFTLNGLDIDGYIHSHYSGTFTTFSAEDIRAIYKIYQAGKMNSLSTFTAGVVTAAGTSYLMKVDDVQAFLNFCGIHFQNETAFQNFDQMYNTNRNAYRTMFGDVDGSELALLNLLKSNNSGLKLFKGSSDFKQWQAVKINSTNTQIEPSICN